MGPTARPAQWTLQGIAHTKVALESELKIAGTFEVRERFSAVSDRSPRCIFRAPSTQCLNVIAMKSWEGGSQRPWGRKFCLRSCPRLGVRLHPSACDTFSGHLGHLLRLAGSSAKQVTPLPAHPGRGTLCPVPERERRRGAASPVLHPGRTEPR